MEKASDAIAKGQLPFPTRQKEYDFSRSNSTSTPMRRTRRAMSLDVISFSHLRWNFVFQRPQHLLSRCAKMCRVFFMEEPVYGKYESAGREIERDAHGVYVIKPLLPESMQEAQRLLELRKIVDGVIRDFSISDYTLWYYDPLALQFSQHLSPRAIVYDCMDELSGFKFAHPRLPEFEQELMRQSDLVFTGGYSLYEAKRRLHPRVHAFPSSVDLAHFAQARKGLDNPPDQQRIGNPVLGFFGVIDERFDTRLIAEVAEARPEWQFVVVGPVVKISPESLPRRENIHYLGSKQYSELPAYLGGWDIAIMPFAHNEATRFISPTKTLEYLAAGKPVISTSIRDVVRPYGDENLVLIADTAQEFIQAAERCLSGEAADSSWLARVDACLERTSWDRTWDDMRALIEACGTATLASPPQRDRRGSSHGREDGTSRTDRTLGGRGMHSEPSGERVP